MFQKIHNRTASQQPSLKRHSCQEGQPGQPVSRRSGREQRSGHRPLTSPPCWLSPRCRRSLGREARTRSATPCGEASRLPSLPGVSVGKYRQTREGLLLSSHRRCVSHGVKDAYDSPFSTCSPGPHAIPRSILQIPPTSLLSPYPKTCLWAIANYLHTHSLVFSGQPHVC